MNKLHFIIGMLLLNSSLLFSQVAVNNDGSQPDPSAMLDVKSTAKGALLPRMTQMEISLIVNPANGLVVFCTTDNKFYTYVASTYTWKEILYGNGTIEKFNCGSPITINHVEGTVAPVSKTVTYGTVDNIPGEPSKCWITSNLGSDNQATAVYDATEASAGWYWQFNSKQGFKHDGSIRTPNIMWIVSTVENSEWTVANDPCIIELGASWHIPTFTEWYDVDNTGGWTKWTGPWNSDLKLHAASYLFFEDGSLPERGRDGYYWSSSQFDAASGWYLAFNSNYCGINYGSKASGFSIRCLSNY
ncbi:MAG: hypothetical protein WCK09_10440 [Bacteroidota bacterium]